MYSLFVSEFGVAPSEYWGMSPDELNLILEAKRPKTINGIREEDFLRMVRRRDELEAMGMEVA